ncbi:MAG: tRNA (cytidine(56)-2'-O)-methyltransferase, partial [Nitrososphaerales archaeon]
MLKPQTWVLRLGHRFVRDDRLTTHVGLVARAFGASGIYIVGGEAFVKASIDKVTETWGGPFTVELVEDWRTLIRSWKNKDGLVVHLTMYGVPVDEVIDEIRSANKELLIVVGAEKVPKEIFHEADYNVAIGNQPHSEAAALAVFLDRLYRGEEFKKSFNHSKLRIMPSSRGKKVVSLKEEEDSGE